MKSSIYIIGYCCIALGLASCSKDEEAVVEEVSVNKLQYMEFTADVGSDTRMQLVEGNKVEWQAGDAISVFDGTGNRLFTTKDSGPTAVFTGEAVQASTYYALYPYQLGATIEGNVLKNVTLPSTQTAKAGTFEAGFNLTVASASAEKMQFDFKNVISLVKFSVSNDRAREVRSVKLTSHDANVVLAGTVDINISDLPTVVLKSEQQPSITLNAPNGLEVGKSYYFSVLPGTLSKGFTLTFANSEGKTWQKSTDASLTNERSNIVNLKSVEIGTFTKALLTNANLIAAAENSTGMMFERNADGSVSLLKTSNLQIANAVKNLDLNGKNDPTICDEIGLFTNLEILDCSKNNIVTLDLSRNLKLKELYCVGGGGTYIDMGDYMDWIDYNGVLSSLTISQNNALEKLDCRGNQLSNIDASNNTALTYLDCSYNILTDLDVSTNTALKYFNCGKNNLTNLNISNNTKLNSFHCGANKLMSLDVSNCLQLDTLTCGNNQLTSLILSGLTKLKKVISQFNQLEELNVTGCTSLTDIWTIENNLQTLDLSTCTNLKALSCGANQLVTLDLSNNTKLQELYCRNNKLTTLDVSNNVELTSFQCYRNHLTSLDVSNNTEISLYNIFVGSQRDFEGNEQTLDLYVNSTQINQELYRYEYSNANVNVLLKTEEGNHEGFNETNYGY
ncbi:MAG: leucine-rich repeat domain-containing protein [Bacteroidaceae bacterium]|nr:leucine-rich repeat domain-containing protein [Bacteroidaceae bacterium]